MRDHRPTQVRHSTVSSQHLDRLRTFGLEFFGSYELTIAALLDKVLHNVEIIHVLTGRICSRAGRDQTALTVDHVGHQASLTGALEPIDQELQVYDHTDHADRSIGSEASGITQVMIQFAPGKTQSLHRHPGEAWLYVVEGHGHSFLGTAPDKGEHHRWKKGDLIVVDHFLWHQHFNDDPENQCRLVRVHMFDSVLETMRALMDPMVLFEEAEDTLVSMAELSKIQWPEDKRPE